MAEETLAVEVEEEDGEETLVRRVAVDEVQVAAPGQEIRLWPTTFRSTCRLTLF